MKPPAEHSDDTRQDVEKRLPAAVVLEDRPSLIPPARDVPERPFVL